MILAANHASHLDTGLLVSSLPVGLRHHTIVAAAADYFFDRHWKAAFWSFGLGAIPMERSKLNRRSADLAAELIDDGWSLIIFPEGGRSTDGWGREFKGGASYLAKRCSVPVIPVHIRGTRAVLAKSSSRFRPGSTEIRLGDALVARDHEDARKFAARIEQAVAALADEAESDWWSARRRAAAGTTPPISGSGGLRLAPRMGTAGLCRARTSARPANIANASHGVAMTDRPMPTRQLGVARASPVSPWLHWRPLCRAAGPAPRSATRSSLPCRPSPPPTSSWRPTSSRPSKVVKLESPEKREGEA